MRNRPRWMGKTCTVAYQYSCIIIRWLFSVAEKSVCTICRPLIDRYSMLGIKKGIHIVEMQSSGTGKYGNYWNVLCLCLFRSLHDTSTLVHVLYISQVCGYWLLQIFVSETSRDCWQTFHAAHLLLCLLLCRMCLFCYGVVVFFTSADDLFSRPALETLLLLLSSSV